MALEVCCPRCGARLLCEELRALVGGDESKDEGKAGDALSRKHMRFRDAPDVRRDGGIACRVCDVLRGEAVAS